MGDHRFGYGYGDRRRMSGKVIITGTGYSIREPVVLKECIKCGTMVDRNELFHGVCRGCPPPKLKELIDESR